MIVFEESAELTELLLENSDRHLRVEWRATSYEFSSSKYQKIQGGMVYLNHGSTTFLTYVLSQLERQAAEAGVQIEELTIGRDKAFPEDSLVFERRSGIFMAKTPSTGKCVNIF